MAFVVDVSGQVEGKVLLLPLTPTATAIPGALGSEWKVEQYIRWAGRCAPAWISYNRLGSGFGRLFGLQTYINEVRVPYQGRIPDGGPVAVLFSPGDYDSV